MVLITLHDPGRLPGMGIGPNLQQDVGGADSELLEEDIRHAGVIVLTRMDQADAAAGWGLHRPEERRDLHEVGPGADNAVDVSRHWTGTSGVRVATIQVSESCSGCRLVGWDKPVGSWFPGFDP